MSECFFLLGEKSSINVDFFRNYWISFVQLSKEVLSIATTLVTSVIECGTWKIFWITSMLDYYQNSTWWRFFKKRFQIIFQIYWNSCCKNTGNLCISTVCRKHTVGIPMGTKCAPLLADRFLFFYEAEIISKVF